MKWGGYTVLNMVERSSFLEVICRVAKLSISVMMSWVGGGLPRTVWSWRVRGWSWSSSCASSACWPMFGYFSFLSKIRYFPFGSYRAFGGCALSDWSFRAVFAKAAYMAWVPLFAIYFLIGGGICGPPLSFAPGCGGVHFPVCVFGPIRPICDRCVRRLCASPTASTCAGTSTSCYCRPSKIRCVLLATFWWLLKEIFGRGGVWRPVIGRIVKLVWPFPSWDGVFSRRSLLANDERFGWD